MELSVKPNPRVRFHILHEDADLLVIDKPAGLVTQPGKGHASDSLLNGLFEKYGTRLQNLGAKRDFGLLHRLDRDTSGLLIVGLQPDAYDRLRSEFEERRIKKRYWALTWGVPKRAQGTVQQEIREVAGTMKRAVLSRGGKPATTAYRLLQTGELPRTDNRRRDYRPIGLIEARPATGRLHQIRVHLASIGSPLLGDDVYGRDVQAPRVPRLCLHAFSLSFVHPTTTRRVEFKSNWPSDLASTLGRFGMNQPG